jgi:N-acetylglucosaminyl-diphospho-decaprenol L-rhamnosyltransferase
MTLRLTVVVVCYGEDVSGLLDELGRQRAPGDEVVVVDNLAPQGGTTGVHGHPQVDRLIESPGNLGYAPAVNLGAREAAGDVVLIVNPDAIPEPGCLDALRTPPAEWEAWMGVVVLPGDRGVNSSGGESHFLGFSWAGGYGDDLAALAATPYPTGFLSGACLAVRTGTWRELGGYPEHYFIYHEDVDISHRLRLWGRGFGVVPNARVVHDYEFVKGPRKWRLLERNRVKTLIRTYPPVLLAAVTPLLAVTELGVLAMAVTGGWLRPKLQAYGDVVAWLPRARSERREIQRRRAVSERVFAAGLTAELDSPFLGAAGRSPVVRAALRVAWHGVRAVLPR